ncbi:hypothetical protein DYB25_008454 [Aphanomyces astaci]|nr:hypothetical protein DYB36_010527 [Aphanomyces astaci]RHY25183.1 hypothetical protein DYB25_008454 [Aphanomyces astaci]RHY69309.1 hypothetical protein DYB34_009214 [Aphanomyces astaci]RHY77596.1 hypothetical protein DYB38_005794 [Aphanomyces astaci]RHY78633.1 hypothetical protein DYB31_005955 [Aphanomyces astaci]
MQQWAADKRTQAAALHRQGKQSDAVAAYTTAIDMDKDDVEAYVGRGRLFVEMQRMDEARQDVEAALKLHPLHEAAVELQHKLLHHASSSSSMEDAMLARMKGDEGGSGGVASSKHPDRLRALLEMDIQSHAKEKKKDKKEHKKKEKKKHKKRSRSHDNRSSSSSSARKKSR